MDWVEAHRDLRRLHQSPVSVSNQLTCCQLGWKSHPIIIIEGSFLPSVFVLKPRLHGLESSLHSYPISPSRILRRVGTTTAYATGFCRTDKSCVCRIAAHPCKKRKEGAPSVGMAHTKIVEDGPHALVEGCVANGRCKAKPRMRLLQRFYFFMTTKGVCFC